MKKLAAVLLLFSVFAAAGVNPPVIWGPSQTAKILPTNGISGTKGAFSTSVTTPIIDSASSLTLKTNSGTAAVTIDTSQKVGIGTTSPLVPLHIAAATATQQLQSTTGTNAVYTKYSNTGGNGYIGIEPSTGGQIVTGASAYSMSIAPPSSKLLQFGYSGGAGVAATIDSSGNVGIGTTSPGQKLDVYKAASGTGKQNSVRYSTDGYGTGDGIYQQYYATGASVEVGKTGVSFNAGLASWSVENLYNSGAQTATHFIVQGDGKVGIGTNPSFLLDVGSSSARGVLNLTGTSSLYPYIRIDNTNKSGGHVWSIGDGINTSGTFTIYDTTAAATRMEIDSSGNATVGGTLTQGVRTFQSGTASITNGTTKTFTIASSAIFSTHDFSMACYATSGGGYVNVKIFAGGYLGGGSSYYNAEIVKSNQSGLVLGSITKNSGNYTFTVQNSTGNGATCVWKLDDAYSSGSTATVTAS